MSVRKNWSTLSAAEKQLLFERMQFVIEHRTSSSLQWSMLGLKVLLGANAGGLVTDITFIGAGMASDPRPPAAVLLPLVLFLLGLTFALVSVILLGARSYFAQRDENKMLSQVCNDETGVDWLGSTRQRGFHGLIVAAIVVSIFSFLLFWAGVVLGVYSLWSILAVT